MFNFSNTPIMVLNTIIFPTAMNKIWKSSTGASAGIGAAQHARRRYSDLQMPEGGSWTLWSLRLAMENSSQLDDSV